MFGLDSGLLWNSNRDPFGIKTFGITERDINFFHTEPYSFIELEKNKTPHLSKPIYRISFSDIEKLVPLLAKCTKENVNEKYNEIYNVLGYKVCEPSDTETLTHLLQLSNLYVKALRGYNIITNRFFSVEPLKVIYQFKHEEPYRTKVCHGVIYEAGYLCFYVHTDNGGDIDKRIGFIIKLSAASIFETFKAAYLQSIYHNFSYDYLLAFFLEDCIRTFDNSFTKDFEIFK